MHYLLEELGKAWNNRVIRSRNSHASSVNVSWPFWRWAAYFEQLYCIAAELGVLRTFCPAYAYTWKASPPANIFQSSPARKASERIWFDHSLILVWLRIVSVIDELAYVRSFIGDWQSKKTHWEDISAVLIEQQQVLDAIKSTCEQHVLHK